jgi:hypothetical protein
MASAIRFFEEVRVLFAVEELVQRFSVVLEYYTRSDIRNRLGGSTLRWSRGDFHSQTIVNCLQSPSEGILVIERRLPPHMEEDLAISLGAPERASAASSPH